MSENNILMRSNDLTSTITAGYEKFSKSEKKIADYLLNNKEEFQTLTIYEIAKNIGTSTATISRFCKTLGYDGLAEMKFHMQEQDLTPVPKYAMNIRADDTINVIKQKALQFTLEEVQSCVMQVEDDLLEQVIEKIGTSRQVIFVAMGTASGLASTAVSMFLASGIAAGVAFDPLLQLRTAVSLGEGDVVIGISYDGYSKSTADALMVAKDAGAYTVLITSDEESICGQFADVILPTPKRAETNAMSISATSLCQLALIQSLVVGTVTKYYKKLEERAKKQMKVSNLQRYDKKQKDIPIERLKV